MSNWNLNVPRFVDGVSTMSAASVNPVVAALADRDEWLFEAVNAAAAETKLVATNQPIQGNLAKGIVVYFDTSTGTPVLTPALSSYTSAVTDGHLFPAEKAYVFGIIKQVYAGSGENGIYYGDIYVRGLITDDTIDFNTVLDTETLNNISTLTPGPLFLSAKDPGKLSIYPSGASVFVGYFLGNGSIVLAPNIDSLSQLYFNYQVYLTSASTGTPSIVTGTQWSAGTASFSTLGWMNAADAVSSLGIVAPTGAKYFYNIPTDSDITAALNSHTITHEQAQQAVLLKKALPAHPASYTMLFINGVLQTQQDADHVGIYIIDSNGIWWTNNNTGYLPWANNPTIQLHITKLNPDYAASIVTSITSTNPAIQVVDKFGVTSKTGDLDLTLNLNISNNTTSTGTGSAIQTLSYDAGSGVVSAISAPVINHITAGPGLTYNVVNGQATIALNNFSLSGEVTDIEPEESDFVYKGLHSYLRIKRPQVNQKIGFIGKIKLPSSIPANTNLVFSLLAFTETGSLSSTVYNWVFEYATSNTASSISTAVTSSALTIPANNFPSLAQATIVNKADGTPAFIVPSSAFTANSYVNFRIARTYDTLATNSVGIIGVTWTIG